MKLIIKKISNSFLYIDCEYSISQELNDFFTFDYPGAKFMPSYKRGFWDGKTRLYQMKYNRLPYGLLYFLIEFCKTRDYEYVLDNDIKLNEELDIKNVLDFIKNLNPPFDILEHQYRAIVKGLKTKRNILLSPTSSGKSFITYAIVSYFSEVLYPNQNILIVVPNTSLVEQLKKDFIYYGGDGKKYHQIYEGREKETDCNIIISTWQSIYKMPQSYFEKFKMIIGDECHLFQAKSLTGIMNKCVNADYRIGLTGTLQNTDCPRLILQGNFGKIYKVTTTKKLQDANIIAQLSISRILLNHTKNKDNPYLISNRKKKVEYHEEIDYLVNHEKRNNFITKLALGLKGNTLILFRYVEKHGKVLYNKIKEINKEDRKIFFVSGEVDTDVRESIRSIVETQNNAIIVASIGVFSTGINIRNLHNIIFAISTKSQITVLQSIGRGLRKSDNEKPTKLYDLIDKVSNIGNYTYNHGYERLKIYKQEKFVYKTTEIIL